MRAAQLKKRPKHFLNFTGLSVEQFEQLVAAVEVAAVEVAAAVKVREDRPRQRAIGGGRKAKLGLEDQLALMLMYYRL